MEPKFNSTLLVEYLRSTNMTERLFGVLLHQLMDRVDDTTINISYPMDTLLLAFVAATYRYTDYHVMMYVADERGVVVITRNGDDFIQLSVSEKDVVATVDSVSQTYPGDTVDHVVVFVEHLIKQMSTWNTSVDTIVDAIEYLTHVQRLTFEEHPIYPYEILARERAKLMDGVADIDRIAYELEERGNNETTEDEPETQPNEITDDVSPELPLPQEIPPFELVRAQDKLRRMGDIVRVVQNQAGHNVRVDVVEPERVTMSIDGDDGTLSCVLSLVDNEKVTLEVIVDGVAITSPFNEVQTHTDTAFVESINTIFNMKLGMATTEKAALANSSLVLFVSVVLSIFASGASAEDIHLPEADETGAPETTAMDAIWDTADTHYEDILETFKNTPLVRIAQILKQDVKMNPEHQVFDDDEEYTVTSFPELISVAYASDLVRNSKIHAPDRLLSFVAKYVSDIVSVNWNPGVVEKMSVTPFKNVPNWVVDYKIDDVLNSILELNHGEVTHLSDSDMHLTHALPQTFSFAELRKHINGNNIIVNLPEGLCDFSVTNAQNEVIRCRYLKIPKPAHLGEANINNDTLVIYVETSPQHVRMVPVYTSSETGTVDSLNSFTSIRETEWPQIVLYLDNVLDILGTTSDSANR